MTDERTDDLFDDVLDEPVQPVHPMESRHGVTPSSMSDAELIAAADAVQRGDIEPDEMSVWDGASPATLERIAVEASGAVDTSEELDDKSDPGGFVRYARLGNAAREAGLDYEQQQLVLSGSSTIAEVLARKQMDAQEAEAFGKEPENWMEEISDAQILALAEASRTGVPVGGVADSEFRSRAKEFLGGND